MLNAGFLRICLITLLFSLTVAAQNYTEIHSNIRKAIENRDYATAVSELQNLERADKKIFTLNNYDYLLARTAEKQNDYATATAYYEAVVKRDSVLTEYALWHLSQIARSSGNLMLERVNLRQLLTIAPSSLLTKAATARMMRSNFESKDFETVVSGQWSTVSAQDKSTTNISQPATNQSSKIKDRETLVYLAQSYLQLGKTNEARDIFTELAINSPNRAQPDDYALAGARGLDELAVGKENYGKVAPQLSDVDHFQRASIYQFNRDFAFARLHFEALVKNFPQSNFASDAMYQIGRGYVQEYSFEQAINWFERVLAEFPDLPIARDALSQLAAAYSRVNKPKEAISRYQKFIEKYPDAENLDRAFLNIIDVKRDAGEDSDALKWTQKTRENFKGKLAEAIALFAQVRIRISQDDWADALTDLNTLQTLADLGGTRVPGGTNPAEVTFLKGFVLENLGRYTEAIDVYLSILDGRGEYYGWRATERLKTLAGNEKSSQAVLQKFNPLRDASNQALTPQSADAIRQSAQTALRLTNDETVKPQLLETIRKTYALIPAYQKIPNAKLFEFGRKETIKEPSQVKPSYHQALADELLFLSLYDEGTPELETALREKLTKNTNSLSDFQPDTAYTLAVFYNRGDMANRAIGYFEAFWKNIPADYQIELIPREQAQILYPAPYTDALLQHATPRNVDPRFALSIMRQESRYRPDVKSYAAARGLMQFISTTSDKLAAELGKKDFKQDELYNPPTAILFGSQYLSNLFTQFPQQPPAVAASYNGGEINMARWMARSKSSDADRYVPEIIFTQSKDYVYKVMANYRVYQSFYNDKLIPR